MKTPKYHVFACSSSRINGQQQGFCMKKDSIEIIQNLMMGVQEEGLTEDVMITNTGCFGICKQGPIVVIYPEGTWYGDLSPEDVEEIVESHLKNGEVVEHLEI